IFWQGIRNSQSQEHFLSMVRDARNEASGAKDEALAAKAETTGLRADLVVESARRQQAEKDLGISVRQSETNLTKQMVRTEGVLKTDINTYRMDTTSAVSKLIRPGRSFTPAQRESLVR